MQSSANCSTCSCPFDYHHKTATIICAQKHYVCKECAESLASNNLTCPHCFGTLTYQNDTQQTIPKQPYNPYVKGNSPISQPVQKYFQNNHPTQDVQEQQNYIHPQTNSNPSRQPQNNPYQQNIPYGQPQYNENPYNVQGMRIHPNQNLLFCSNPKKLICLFFVFVVCFVLGTVMVTLISQCSFYGRYSCSYGDFDGYMCCTYSCPSEWYDWNCKTIAQLQGPRIMFYPVMAVGGLGALITLIKICHASSRLRKLREQQYARV